MSIARTRTFRSGNSQAVRLPRDVAFGDDVELVVVRSGDVVTMYPATATPAELVKRLREMPNPATIEVRDQDEIPDRDGL
jgi:antitoxin VapB